MNFREQWDLRRIRQTDLRESGQVQIVYTGTKTGKLHVTAPPNPVFEAEAPGLCGRWKSRSEVWSFPMPLLRLVYTLCCRVYGPDKVTYQGPDYQGILEAVEAARNDQKSAPLQRSTKASEGL